MVEEIENQAMEDKQHMTTDDATVTTGRFAPPIPFHRFVKDANGCFLGHRHKTGFLSRASGPHRPPVVARSISWHSHKGQASRTVFGAEAPFSPAFEPF